MNFQPQNRYLLVKTQTQEDAENTGVLLPEGYISPKDKYVLAGERYEIVLENYVVGMLLEEE